jgi:hypothetical protein
VRRDIQKAVSGWLDFTNATMSPLQSGTAVLHFRCGDIILGDGNAQYGLPTFGWCVVRFAVILFVRSCSQLTELCRYANNIPEDATDVQVVGNIDSTISGGHISDAGGEKKCSLIMDAFIAFLKEHTRKPVKFVAKGANEDFALMVNAPTLIGSISTYALWAGIANGNGNVIMPNCTLFLGRPPSREAPPVPHVSVPGVRLVEVEAIQSVDDMQDRYLSQIPIETVIKVLAGEPPGGSRVAIWHGHMCVQECDPQRYFTSQFGTR